MGKFDNRYLCNLKNGKIRQAKLSVLEKHRFELEDGVDNFTQEKLTEQENNKLKHAKLRR